MTKFAQFAFAAAAVATLAGCPSGTGAMIPGVGGASTAPGVKGADAALAAQCSASAPAAAAATGTAKHGRYDKQLLPNTWDNLESEAKITESIDKFIADAGTGDAAKVNQWNCFNKFYPGTLTVYYGIKGIK